MAEYKSREFGGHPKRAIPSQALKREGVTTRTKVRTAKRLEVRGGESPRDSLLLQVTASCHKRRSLSCDQRRRIGPYSGKLDALAQWDVKRPVMQALKNDAVKTFDRAVHTQFNNCLVRVTSTNTTSINTTTNGTMTATNSANYTSTHHKLVIDLMKERNIPPYLGDDYVALAWPSTFRPLKNNLETLHAYSAPGLGLIMAGEIGRYENCRFVEQTNILKGTSNNGTAWTNGYSDWIYFFGEDTVMEGVVIPEEIRAKIPTDYGRSKGVAYYALMGWGIVAQDATNTRIVKWDSAA